MYMWATSLGHLFSDIIMICHSDIDMSITDGIDAAYQLRHGVIRFEINVSADRLQGKTRGYISD